MRAGRVDVIDAESQVAEVARGAVILVRTPVVRELDFRVRAPGRRQEHQCEAALRHLPAPGFAQTESVAVEPQRRIQVAHAHHAVQVFHLAPSPIPPSGIRLSWTDRRYTRKTG